MNKKQYSKMIKKLMQEQTTKANLQNENAVSEMPLQQEKNVGQPEVALAKTTRLVFFRRYLTYQALLEIHTKKELSVEACFSKVVLYIMRWFRNRLGKEIFEEYSEISFLKENYPEPDDYEQFDIESVADISGLDFIDFETLYVKKNHAWLMSLEEPDNGNENKDINGRSFTTEVSVYKRDTSVVLGIREACREPKENTEDAFGYRPGFVRDIFFDSDMIIGEQGLNSKYAFATEPLILNGKSGEKCDELYRNLINSEYRQMPILFVPEKFYEKNKEGVDKKTVSLLGYCHVLVWTGTPLKLFAQIMNKPEFADVAEEGQLIFFRTTANTVYPTDYFEPSAENMLENVKHVAQIEPRRKNCDFKEFSFKPAWWEISKKDDFENIEQNSELKHAYETEISRLNTQIRDLERDNDQLQRKIDSLETENKSLDEEIRKTFVEIGKSNQKYEAMLEERDDLKEMLKRAESQNMQSEIMLRAVKASEKERYEPLLHLPPLGMDAKSEILKWISTYFSDVIEVQSNAEKAFYADDRNLDWHRFCMMIHYLAGYTRYRNEGGQAINAHAAREYDPEEAAYRVEPVSSGAVGSAEMFKDKYSVKIENSDGKLVDVIMDMHLKYGKGRDSNMIRIYFYYDKDAKKSIIGYMPGHLPTRSNIH